VIASLFRRRAAATEPLRWVVLDVEASGLDAANDRLIAIAAVALEVDWPGKRLVLRPADSFEVVLQQPEVPADKANILLHGIGVGAQREGLPPAEALAAFRQYAGAAPLLAFHAAFDRTLVGRYARTAQGEAMPNDWADIEHLCASLHPKVRARALDDWLAHFGIECAARHQALADALAEAELLLRLWPALAAECRGWRDVARLAQAHRWVR
jgi:DNA polymerase III subunit epsilon